MPSAAEGVLAVYSQFKHLSFSVHLQPDGLWEGEREPAHRGFHRALARARGHGRQDVCHIQRAVLQGGQHKIGKLRDEVKCTKSVKKKIHTFLRHILVDSG